MTEVYYSRVLDVPAPDVWKVVRDFGAFASWCPNIDSSTLGDGETGQVGSIRTNQLKDDGGTITEKLLALSDPTQTLIYSVLSAPLPVSNYVATIVVHPVAADGRSFVSWHARFDAEGDVEGLVGWIRSGVFEACLIALEGMLKH